MREYDKITQRERERRDTMKIEKATSKSEPSRRFPSLLRRESPIVLCVLQSISEEYKTYIGDSPPLLNHQNCWVVHFPNDEAGQTVLAKGDLFHRVELAYAKNER